MIHRGNFHINLFHRIHSIKISLSPSLIKFIVKFKLKVLVLIHVFNFLAILQQLVFVPLLTFYLFYVQMLNTVLLFTDYATLIIPH